MTDDTFDLRELCGQLIDDFLPGGILVANPVPDFSVLFANRNLLEMLGYNSVDELNGALSEDTLFFVHPDDILQMRTTEKGHEGDAAVHTFRMKRHDGTYFWVEGRITAKRLSEGRTVIVAYYADISHYKATEQRLLESDERYRVAVDGAGVNVWEYDIRRKCIIQSDGSIRNHGFSRTIENVPQVLVDTGYVAEENQEEFLEMYRRMERGETPVGGDFWVYNAEKDRRWCERIIYSVVFDENGRPVRAYGSSQNITSFKIAEKRYEEEIDYLNKESAHAIAAVRVNLTQKCLEEFRIRNGEDVTDRYRSKVEFESRIHAILFDAVLNDEQRYELSVRGLLERYARSEESYETDFVAQKTKNQYIWARCRVNILKRPDTRDVIAFFYTEDVTQQKTLSGILENIVEKDYERVGRIDAASRSYTLFSGTAPERERFSRTDYETELQRHISLCTDEASAEKLGRELSIDNIVKVLNTDHVFTCETGEKGTDGSLRRKRLKFFYLNREAGFILAAQTDITDIVIKEQEKQRALEEAVNAKNNFLSRMSHDMRTPLNGIIGMTYLAGHNSNPPQTKSCLEKIDTSSKFLLGLINDILVMTKAEQDEVKLHPEPYGTGEFLDYLDSVIRPLCAEKNQTFTFESNLTDSSALMLDKLRFNQVVFNLLSNAVKYTPEGGSIGYRSILGRENPDGTYPLKITIRDTGIGMSSEFQRVLFEPFAREDRSETKQIQGTGLGLSIVRRMVELSGGTISVESQIGSGSVFTITFDVRCVPVGRVKERRIPDTELSDTEYLSGRHILLCEDHPLNQEIAKTLLEQKEMIVSLAHNGQEGVEQFRQSPPGYFDAVLMDIQMPVMNGYEAARSIRALRREDAGSVPILAMTADAFDDDRKKCHAAGMNGHIAKPVNPEAMFRLLISCIQKGKQMQEDSAS